MNVYLLGAQGFVGRHLKVALESVGHKVWCHDRPSHQLRDLAISYADMVINAAGETEVEQFMERDNHQVAIKVAESAAAHKKRLIHIGSLMELYPDSIYAKSKLAATDAILAMSGLNACVVRAATVYGNDDKSRALLPALWRAFHDESTFSCINDFREWIHVDDLANAIVGIIDHSPTLRGIVNLSGSTTDIESIVSLFEAALGNRGIRRVVIPGESYIFDLTYPIEARSLSVGIQQFVDHHLFSGAWLGAEN